MLARRSSFVAVFPGISLLIFCASSIFSSCRVDENMSSFNLSELKDQARENKLQVGGSKAQLMMRLIEAEVVTPTWRSQ